MKSGKSFSPLLLALLAQFAGVLTGLVAWRVALMTPDISSASVWIGIFFAAMVATLSGKYLFNLPNWWLPINAMFIPAVCGALALHLPGWVYPAAFAITLAVFWNVRSERVPLYLSNPTTWRALSEILTNGRKSRFVDLGSGIGGTLRFLASRHRDVTFTGVENAPVPLLISRIRQWIDPVSNLRIFHGDFWALDLAEFDVVYCFLSPTPMTRLYEKAKREMRPGSLLISNSFDVTGQPPDEILTLDDSRQTRLLIWRF